MNSKYVRVFLACLALISATTFAADEFGTPPLKYQTKYNYYSHENDKWTLIGSKTYHCDYTVTSWGVESELSMWIKEPCK